MAKANCWKDTNIPVIKMEPRDTSPQPFGLYRAPPEFTPSPQPLSPSGVNSHNTTSPYHMNRLTAEQQGKQQTISPNQQYNGASSVINAPVRMDISNYNNFTHQVQQQHCHDNRFGCASNRWQGKFNPLPVSNVTNIQNRPLPPANVTESPTPALNNANWNLTYNHFHQYSLHLPPSDAASNTNGSDANMAGTTLYTNAVGNANYNEHSLSNLLTIDSEQYVRINSEDQQMLRLNSEDLQISNLSIST